MSAILDDEVSETRALIDRLRHDARTTREHAEYMERDSEALKARAARKRQQADVWQGAANRLEYMLVNGELQEPMAAKEGENENVSAPANSE